MSPEERAALVRMAEGLRTEISDLTAERDAARVNHAASADDARLIAEVKALSDKRDAAQAERDEAVSATEAIDIMRKLLDEEATKATPLVEPPVEPSVEAPVQAESAKITKGGSR